MPEVKDGSRRQITERSSVAHEMDEGRHDTWDERTCGKTTEEGVGDWIREREKENMLVPL